MNDFLANVARSVENGLARDEAIKAMTLRAAEILDVDSQLGTIEPGKIANLTIVRGDIFDRNRRITHVFIDGRPVDLRPTPAAPAGAGGAQAAGTWSVRVTLQGMPDRAVTLILQQQGEQLSGSLQGDLGSAQIANASVGRAGELHFTAPITTPAQTVEATFDGTITGNEMSGTVTLTGGQPGSFSGTRAATPTASPTAAPGAARPPASGSATTSLAGTWTINVEFGGRAQTATLNLQQEGERLSGTLQGPMGASEISNGSVGADGSFRFTTTLNLGGQTVELTYAGTASGNQMNGTLTTPRGAIPFTGTKQP
jgi:Amidohydrolase family